MGISVLMVAALMAKHCLMLYVQVDVKGGLAQFDVLVQAFFYCDQILVVLPAW